MNPDLEEAQELPLNHYSGREIWKRFRPMIAPHAAKLVIAAFCVSVVGLAISIMPLFPKYVIDTAIPRESWKMAAAAGALFLASQLVRMALWYVAMIQVYTVQQQVVFRLRADAFARLQRLCLRFHHQFPSGFLYERVFGNSIATLSSFVQVVFTQLTTYLVGLLFSLGFCLYLSPSLTAVIVAGTVGYVIAARAMSRRIYQRTKAVSELSMRFVEMTMDKLRGHKTIQAFAMEDRVQQEFERQAWPLMSRWLEATRENMKLGFITEGLSYAITAIIVVGGAAMVMRSHQPVGTLVAFMGYQGTLIGFIQTLTNVYGQFAATRQAFDQLFTVMDTPSTVPEKPTALMPARITGDLSFSNLTFAYETEPVIRDFTVDIPHGQVLALVGRSGSGKTTLTNLLMRFYDPQSGTIQLDGADIRDLPLRPYRHLFSVVLQDPYLFNTTIAHNLRIARPEATDEELIEALRKAHAWEFVEKLPLGLHQPVGEGGTQISGGQRQRLAIARCILVPSRFLLLDEATSALDAESEMVVQDSFRPLFAGRTAIIIAHRLSTIRYADRILVMDHGRLVEEGSFDQLLAKRGLFHHLHSIATSTSTHRIKIEEAGFA